jgi:hypothetical protein
VIRTNRPVVLLLALASLVTALPAAAAGSARRAVVELFTSQGCSSCPPADALAGRLSADPAVLVLSFHVNYWDALGWKDPFATQAGTDRQYAYARAMGQSSVFTPQVVVNGARSVVGSQENAVRKALDAARVTALPVTVDLSPRPDGSFDLVLAGPAVVADIWEVRYVRHSITRIRGGENGGRNLETFNDVTQLRRVGSFQPGTLRLPPLKQPADGIAVFVQKPQAGQILGAVTATDPSRAPGFRSAGL